MSSAVGCRQVVIVVPGSQFQPLHRSEIVVLGTRFIRRVIEHPHEYTADRVDPDRALGRQVDELDPPARKIVGKIEKIGTVTI